MLGLSDLKAKLIALQSYIVATFADVKSGLEWLYNRIADVRQELLGAIGVAKTDAIAGAKSYTDIAIGTATDAINADTDQKIGVAKVAAIAGAKAYTDTTIGTATDAINAATDQKIGQEVTDRNAAILIAKNALETLADSKDAAILAQANAHANGVGTTEAQARAQMNQTISNRLSILENGNFGKWEDFGVLSLETQDGTAEAADLATIFANVMAAEIKDDGTVGKTVKPLTSYVLMLEGNTSVQKSITYTNASGATVTVNASAGEQFVVKTNSTGTVHYARFVANPFMEAKMVSDANFADIQAGLASINTQMAVQNADLSVMKDGIRAMLMAWGIPGN